jgi:uncharacterized protein (DUF1501 family)
MSITRRMLIKNGAVGIFSVGIAPVLGPSFLQRTALAQEAGARKKTLVCLFMRGAADGLSIVVPHGEPELYKVRPNIAIPKSEVVDLDGFFGLHPALSPLAKIYKEGHLAAVHACGSPSNSRSHFDAMDYMESGTPDNKVVQDGWLARTAMMCPEDRATRNSPFRAVALGSGLPRSLQGGAGALAIPDLRTFGIQEIAARGKGLTGSPSAAGGFEALYDQAVGDALHGTGKESFDALKALKKINPGSYTPANGVTYPTGKLGESFKQIAQLIKSGIGVEIAFTDVGGWDTHANQVQNGTPTAGNLANRLRDVGSALSAFYYDMGDRMQDVVVITMSEFGRTVRQNGTGGTDHGHATCFFALGGPVKGGKVYGDWPGLSTDKLYEGRDLNLTTDFRAVFGEVASKHMGVPDVAKLFPGFTGGEQSFRGLIG